MANLKDLDLGPLVGMTRAELRAAFGDPYTCPEPRPPPPKARCAAMSNHHCPTADVWGFAFHYLPPTYRDGAVVLYVEFDARSGAQDRSINAYAGR